MMSAAAADGESLDGRAEDESRMAVGRDFKRGAMDQLMMSIVVTVSFLAGFAIQVLAVVVALWIWNRWPALAMLARRTPR